MGAGLARRELTAGTEVLVLDQRRRSYMHRQVEL